MIQNKDKNSEIVVQSTIRSVQPGAPEMTTISPYLIRNEHGNYPFGMVVVQSNDNKSGHVIVKNRQRKITLLEDIHISAEEKTAVKAAKALFPYLCNSFYNLDPRKVLKNILESIETLTSSQYSLKLTSIHSPMSYIHVYKYERFESLENFVSKVALSNEIPVYRNFNLYGDLFTFIRLNKIVGLRASDSNIKERFTKVMKNINQLEQTSLKIVKQMEHNECYRYIIFFQYLINNENIVDFVKLTLQYLFITLCIEIRESIEIREKDFQNVNAEIEKIHYKDIQQLCEKSGTQSKLSELSKRGNFVKAKKQVKQMCKAIFASIQDSTMAESMVEQLTLNSLHISDEQDKVKVKNTYKEPYNVHFFDMPNQEIPAPIKNSFYECLEKMYLNASVLLEQRRGCGKDLLNRKNIRTLKDIQRKSEQLYTGKFEYTQFLTVFEMYADFVFENIQEFIEMKKKKCKKDFHIVHIFTKINEPIKLSYFRDIMNDKFRVSLQKMYLSTSIFNESENPQPV